MTTSAQSYFRLYGHTDGALAGLDALRGLAILMVLLRHAVRPFWTERGLAPFAGLDVGIPFANGWIGVDLFFVISGFLIAHHLLRAEARGRGFEFGPYLMRRFLRIVPLYYTVLALVMLGAVPFYVVDGSALPLRVLVNALFMQDYLRSDIVVAFWSVAVEEKFYLVAPLLVGVAVGPSSWRARLAGCAAIIVAVVASRIWDAQAFPASAGYDQYFVSFRAPFHHCLDGLAVGMACAILLRVLSEHWDARFSSLVGELLIWTGLGGTVLWLASGELLATISLWDLALQPTFLAITFGALVLGCALGGRPASWLDRTFLKPLGRISYPAYLIHMPLIPLSFVLSGAAPATEPAEFWVFLPVFLVLTVFASLLLHFAVEKPFLLLKTRLSRGRVAASLPG